MLMPNYLATAEAVRRTPVRRSAATAIEDLPNEKISPLFWAVAEATQEAVYNATLQATSTTGVDNQHGRDYAIASWYLSIGRVRLVGSRIHDAIVWLEKARSANPQLPMVHAWLAAAYSFNGEDERAAAELAQARGLSRDGRYSSIARLQAAGHFGVPKIQALIENTFLAGLHKAGMPEE